MKVVHLWLRAVLWTKKKSVPLLVGVAGLAACYYIGRVLTIKRIAMAQVETAAFTLETETYSFEKNPEGEVVGRETLARRSDGASAFVDNVGPIEWGYVGRRVTYPDGRSISVVDALTSKTTWPIMSARSLASFKMHFLHPPRNCVGVGETLAGFGKSSGEDVAIVRAGLRGVAGTGASEARITSWRARDLACQTLQYRVERPQGDGSWKLLTEQRVVSLKPGEPDPRLFDDGSGYTEARPSEVQRRLLRKVGVSPDAEPWKTEAERLDKAYSKKCDECGEQRPLP